MSSPFVHDPPETGAAPKVAVYANQFEIGFNAFEFLFDFGQVYDEDATEAHWRVVTAPAYAKVDAHLRARHGQDIQIHFADDRSDNLEAARHRGWRTIWIAPDTTSPAAAAVFDRTVPSLTRLDPTDLL